MAAEDLSPDWRTWRNQVLDSARLVVIKVGSAVLTSEQGLDLRVVNRLADQIAALHDQGREVILVSSGAVAAGRGFLFTAREQLSLPEKQAAAAVGQSRLMHSYDEAFERYNKVTAQILLTRDDLRSRHRFLNARNTFATLLENGVIPVVNENDTVVVRELKFGDNDLLASLLLNVVKADLFISLTTAEGVYSDNPELSSQATRYECIEDIKEIDIHTTCKGTSRSGSGGMHSKLLSARRASQLGVPTLIVSGKVPFVLEKIFAGQDLGTWIIPEGRAIPRRKFWLAYNLDPLGELVIDAGARDALILRGKSLLPIGVRAVHGCFEPGDLVRILGPSGNELGVGLCNFSSEDLSKICGCKSSDIEEILQAPAVHREAVHRDNLLLDAAH
ncbi:MAG: glutamate 5-kinase [Desulfovermiculus sp.]